MADPFARVQPPRAIAIDQLPSRLPHVSASILSSMQQIPLWHLDSGSLHEMQVVSEDAALQSQVFIIAMSPNGSIASTQRVTHDGEELVPYRLLPDDGGVEMRGRYICEYRAASEGYLKEIEKAKKERVDAIAHCRKLLIDLPVALSRSRTAMDTLLASAEADLSEVGAMTVEQRRIQQEIDAQKKKLSELESSAMPKVDKSRFILHRLQRSVTLKFGANRLGDQVIHVMRPSDMSTPHTVSPVTIDNAWPR